MLISKMSTEVVGLHGGPMRDPDSSVQVRPWFEVREAQPCAGSASSWDFDAQDTEPHIAPWCARGTHERDRVGAADDAADGASDDAVLDLTAIPRAILVFDVNGRIADVNPLAEALVGYTRLELAGQPIDLVASKLASIEPLRRLRFLPASSGACIRHRNGRAIPVEALLCPHDEQSTVAILRAVETTEAGLREDDVAQIVHDLKNPLSTIALETCLLDDKLARGNPSDMRDAFARITHNVEFLDRMVQDLLDLCSLDAGRLQLHRRPTELHALLEQIIDRVVPTRDRERVSLQPAEPLTTSIDDLRIERVVANLLQNALKYAPRSSRIVVRLAAASDAIRISVSDAGPGIAPAEIGSVFDKFRRASTAGGHEGSGLGLYVSKKIIEAHGGQIGVTSVRGAGSQFFFELPSP
jgi:PAS domain S-box-containing protein